MADAVELRDTLKKLSESGDGHALASLVAGVAREVPRSPDTADIFEKCLELLKRVEDPEERRDALFEITALVPPTGAFSSVYREYVEYAITEADLIDDVQPRTTELLKIASGLPRTEEFFELKRLAWRLALGLPDRPRYKEPDLKEISRELPKASDLDFYRRYTLLGIAGQLPREREFLDIYREALTLALDAAEVIEEPYYRKYALLHIADDISEREGVEDIYLRALRDAYGAALSTKDPFAREYTLIEVLKAVPKAEEFYPLLQELLEKALDFFTVRKWMEDIELTDVLDFMLSAEEMGMKESKKRRLLREKYAKRLAAQVEALAETLGDTRFIATLKPYTHVWVQPKFLREAVGKVLENLEELTRKYHGREVLRPVFLKEYHKSDSVPSAAGALSGGEALAIDLGATNTVVMRKRPGGQPEFMPLDGISEHYDNVHVIPTLLSPETDAIGAEVTDQEPVTDIKQLLLDGNPRGSEHMERFFRNLYKRIKEGLVGPGWFSLSSRKLPEHLFVTVPVGFGDYKKEVRRIVARAAKGVKTEFIEEPLAAAIGYEVAAPEDKYIMIVDFGGSTLDTMLLRVNLDEVHVVAKPERAQVLGGSDIDRWLALHLAERLGIPRENIPRKLFKVAEELKIELSKKNEAPLVWDGKGFGVFTRQEFEEVLEDNDFYRLVDRSVSYVLQKAAKVGINKEQTGAVLLTGGSSQIPSFKDKIAALFPELRRANLIYDHSPLTAVCRGASLYGTRDVVDRHLGMAYALRYSLDDEENPWSYAIVLEKGESLPLEKTYRLDPARRHGAQSEMYLELFEVPEGLITRKWVTEAGMEFIRQELQQTRDISLAGFKTVTLPFDSPLDGGVEVTLSVDESGLLKVRYAGKSVDTGLRLQ